MSEELKVESKNKLNKKLLLGTAVLIAIALIAALILFVPRAAEAGKVTEQLSLGDKYLSELEYEQAEAAYLAVLKIDPKNVDAYLGLAEVYLEQGEYEKAEEILNEALERVSGEVAEILKDKLAEVEAAKKAASNTPTPTLSPTPEPTATSTPSPMPEPTETSTPSPTPKPTATSTPSPMPDNNTYTTGNFKWKNKTDGTVIITGFTGVGEKQVIVPSEIEEKMVSEIAHAAFVRSNMESVVISDGIEIIGELAFCECKNLISVTLPSTLVTLGDDAFQQCESLKEIWIEDSDIFYIKDGILFDSRENKLVRMPNALAVSYYEIPEGIEVIGNSAFDSCKNLVTVIIPNSVTILEDDAFARCANLSGIDLPDSVKSIGQMAFWSCISFEKIVIPSDVVYIGKNAFGACRGLREIMIENNATYDTENGVLYNRTEKTLMCMPGNSSIKNYEVPENIEIIDDYAFYQCNNLISITFPEGVLSIGIRSCMSLLKLERVTILSGETKVEEMAFSGCNKLTITAPAESYAEKYAIQNNIPVKNP